MPSAVENIIVESLEDAFTPDPRLSVWEWADRYRYLPKKSSAEPGKYRTDRTPYLREIMGALSAHDPCHEVCVMKGTQLGMTECGNNWFGYVVKVAQGPMLMVFPTESLGREHSKQKLAPTIEETPSLKTAVRAPKSRDSGNTIMVKEFAGGILFITGANAPASFRSKSIRFLFLDDIDGYPLEAGEEGDPVALAKKRTDAYSAKRKIYIVSTPTNKGISRIEREFNESDQRAYYVPCPHCGEHQRLVWGGKDTNYGIRFIRDDETGAVKYVWYECRHCHDVIEEHHKTEMLERGEWRPRFPRRQKRGYHLSSLYSPVGWVSWIQIVEEFLEAKDNAQMLKVWMNTRMGLPFEEAGSQPEWVKLKSRAEPYRVLEIPSGGLLLTSGVDVQDNRLVVVIRAWGRDQENWLVYFGELYGDPGRDEPWKQLDELLNRTYRHASGAELNVASMGVDTGGHNTQAVYNYCRRRMPRVFALKGASRFYQPVVGRPSKQDVTYMGTTIKNGVQLWPVGTDTAKDTIYSRLNMDEPGPGFYHFPIGLEDEYYLQLTAERRINKFTQGQIKSEYVKTRERNDALDCEVYAFAAALRAGLERQDWNALEKALLESVTRRRKEKERKQGKRFIPRKEDWIR